jgi:MYXO-CTERM domain-containing protein
MAVAGQTVRVLVDGALTPVCTMLVAGAGGWQCAPSVALAQGAHIAVAVAANSRGADSPASTEVHFTIDSIAPAAPALTRPIAGTTVALRPLFEGTAEVGSVVKVRVDGQTVPTCSATVDGAGAFSCTSTSDLTEGPHTAQAVAEDVAANVSLPSGSVPFVVGATDDTRPPEVSCPPDITVEADRGGSATVSFTATATDNADPSPKVSSSSETGSFFPEGETVVTVTATDANSNVASCSFRVKVTPSTQTGKVSQGCGCGAGPDGLFLLAGLGLLGRRLRRRVSASPSGL